MNRADANVRPDPPGIDDRDALFLDVDGSLLAFAPTPDGVHVPAALPAALDALALRLDGALALVSGRSIASLDALFGTTRFACAGLHGNELRGEALVASYGAVDALARIRTQAAAVAARHPGAFVEDKRVAVALHWRGAPAAETALRALADASLATLPGYRILQGANVVELLPPGRDKGNAVAHFMDALPFASRRPVFVGDDVTDDAGFREAQRLGGHGIAVGPRRSEFACYGLDSPAAVLDWLTGPADALQPRHAR